ncbi:MAG: cysteine dioxygenase family protein [Myxococcales bacterium]|nr:cysteine dioxygenase family protein [Myxococcales bacterium]MCB9756037.1 cysteine dioxygenase family protein [Myxococcales bacterium]
MTPRQFPGLRALVDMLDDAVVKPTPEAISHAIGGGLTRIISERAIELPACLTQPLPGCYARRLIHASDRLDYTVIAMTWGPGQRTPIHDHSGLWCVEGVVQGTIEVVQYDLVEDLGARCRFREAGRIFAGVGSSGALLPPYEYHTIANTSERASAVTIHVYASEMYRCNVYEPAGESGWYGRARKQLAYSA